MNIGIATRNDYLQLVELDHHIPTAMMKDKIDQGQVIVAAENTVVIGWLRYGYFWDSIPFMNMLTVIEGYRGRGIGTQLVIHWETMLYEMGFREVLTSTSASERGQFLYRKLGYNDCGAILFPNEPLEIVLHKSIAP